MDTALDGSLRDAQHGGGFFVGEPLGLDQDKRLALSLGELRDSGIEAKACEVGADRIARRNIGFKKRQGLGRCASEPLAPAVECHRVQESCQFGAPRKPWPTLKRRNQRLLCQVFRIRIAAPAEPQAQTKDSVSMVVEPALPVFIHAG